MKWKDDFSEAKVWVNVIYNFDNNFVYLTFFNWCYFLKFGGAVLELCAHY